MNSVERVKTICKERKIPISKLEKDLGYANGYIGQLRKGVFPDDRLADIAKYLSVSVEYLMTGNEKEIALPPLTQKDERDIARMLENTMNAISGGADGLMFDGEPIDEETVELLRISLKNQFEMTKRMAKQKYTPKKYRK